MIAAGLAIAAPAGAHGGSHSADDARSTARGSTIELRGCWMTVAVVPRPAAALQAALTSPIAPATTAYAIDPVVALWALACDRGRVERRRIGRSVVALVGVPVEASGAADAPLANEFTHSLVRADTDHPAVAAALRRRRVPATVAPRLRYRHSPTAVVPAVATLDVPGQYRLAVTAGTLDRPHDHLNRFDVGGGGAAERSLRLVTSGANDRFCLSASGSCTARVAAPSRSPLRPLLGAASAKPLIAFDHLRLRRVGLGSGGAAAQ